MVVGKASEYRRSPISSQPETTSGIPPASLDRSLALVRFLRGACPWDAAQTPRSLIPYLLEEAHEVADAIAEERTQDLPGELGDLLLNVAFQVVLAEEQGAFGAAEVVAELESKMRRRHPHLYGEGEAEDWETLKSRERGRDSLLSGLAKGLDPLTRAHRIQERVAAVGFDWSSAHGAFDKVAEELEEVREAMIDVAGATADARPAAPAPEAIAALEEELGDLLFAVVNLTRLAGTHALHALGRANAKFAARFAALEILAAERGVRLGEATLEELDALWEEVKWR